MPNKQSEKKTGQQAPDQAKEKEKDSVKKTDDEYVYPEPDTESVPPSPVKGQPAG
jgi:hypothetical protein